ncbi:TonB-dependent receptor [Fluviispira multicolorata]|uniref:TonB-dependent receptor plug domain-containing protein n=1 Tax=Fluviispira multicolorata TaxID=2654512 RepID=A0A833JBF2_9BACT|nr:TonB-dependent receptor [Fluviispira multicolorata]KAB8029179.1 TonB-dependent receptor plug domain-containing protein [Fluviispira multicolorata]
MYKIIGVLCGVFPNFIYAQNSMSIPVISDTEKNEKTSDSKSKNQTAKDSVENPASLNVNQENVSVQTLPGSAPSPKSIADLTDKVTSAQVEHFGGEAGALRVRLRGSRAFEPTYYFNGFVLTGAGSGEQNLSLLPNTFVGQLNVYPDAPPFWLSSMGIGGDINIKSCRRISCFYYGKNAFTNLFKLSTRIGSFGYKEASVIHSIKISKHTEIFSTLDYITSQENYSVFNNNNSSLSADIGTYEKLQNNDFSKTSGGIGLSSYNEFFGKIKFDLAFGLQNKGVPAEVGSQAGTQRLNRNLLLTTLSSEKIFAENGLQWNNQIGFLYNTADNKNFNSNSNFASQAANSTNTSVQVKTFLILPSNLISHEQTGVSLDFNRSEQETNTTVPNSSSQMNSHVNVNRTEVRSALFEAVIFPITEQWIFSSNVNAWISFAGANANMVESYPSVDSSSSLQKSDREKPVSGYTFSLQNKFYEMVHYIRYVKSQRRPYLSEVYGSPDGVIPNVNLVPESSQKVETGFNFPIGEIGYFYAKDTDLIFLKAISQTTFQYDNIEDSSRNGMFLYTDYYLTKFWNIGFSYQYLLAKMHKNGEETDVPRSARHYFNASTSIENISLGHIFSYETKFAAYANMNWQSSFYLDYTNSSQMDIPPIYNSGFAFSFQNTLLAQAFSLSLDIYNIANESFATLSNSTGTVQSVQSNGYLGFPPPGRRVYLTLSGEF